MTTTITTFADGEGSPPRPGSPKLGDFSAILSAFKNNFVLDENAAPTPTKPRKARAKRAVKVGSPGSERSTSASFNGGFFGGLDLTSILSKTDDEFECELSDTTETGDETDPLDETDTTDTDDSKLTNYATSLDSVSADDTVALLKTLKKTPQKTSQSPTRKSGRNSPVKNSPTKKHAVLRTPTATPRKQMTAQELLVHRPMALPPPLGLIGTPSSDHPSISPLYWCTRNEKLDLVEKMLKDKFKFDKNPSGSSASAEPIHVFVDLSNIAISFYNTIRAKHNVPGDRKMHAPPFFFEAFAKVIERGRPVERKVVAGSLPHDKIMRPDSWPVYMQEAKQLGYEMNILSRVAKAPSASKSSSSMAVVATNTAPTFPQYGGFSPISTRTYGSPSITFGQRPGSAVILSQQQQQQQQIMYSPFVVRPLPLPPPTPVAEQYKLGEQCVDELLHLKMLQSLLDYEPSTIVLATGDACEAEFSDGFLKQVERAIRAGWHVELATWTCGISNSWQAMKRQYKRTGQFRIIELDPFCEEFLAIFDP